MKEVAVVSKDEQVRLYLSECVPRGYIVTYFKSILEITQTEDSGAYSLGIIDTDYHYNEFILHQQKPDRLGIPWIAISSAHNIGRLLGVAGSYIDDIVQKPIQKEMFKRSIFRHMVETRLHEFDISGQQYHENVFVGRSQISRKIRQRIYSFSKADDTVLISGESGTGKEVVAKCIADASRQPRQQFHPQNLAAIPKDLIESTLFGAVPGAFTGARNTEGLFESCGKGTVFLDEIGELDLSGQTKLLRILETGEYCRLGSTVLKHTKSRIISATNRNLKHEVQCGRFRQDLYYRLKVLHIHIPPLRSRKEDIPFLIFHFLKNLDCGITSRAIVYLTACSWPGNVRELLNTLKRAALLCSNKKIDIRDLMEN